MSEKEKRVAEIVDLFSKEVISPPTSSTVTAINGNGNILAGGDVHYHKNEKKIIRRPFTPGPQHIIPSQAKKLQNYVYKLAEIEAAAGVLDGNVGRLRARWWKRLNNHFGVTTYKEIPAELGEDAIKWMSQQVAMNRKKLRKTDKTFWRNEHYSSIYAKTAELSIPKGQLYAIVKDRIGPTITSLKQLSDQNLKKLYSIVMAM